MAKVIRKFCAPILVLLITTSRASEIPDNTAPVNPPEIPLINPPEQGSSTPCEEWETIFLTRDDVEVDSTKPEVEVKSGNLKGRIIPFHAFYEWNTTTRTGRACACEVSGQPCIPLCCQSNQLASFNGGKLTCVNTKNNMPNSTVLDVFARHLVLTEKLEEHKFIIVHHDGLETLKPCPNAAMFYKPEIATGGHRLDTEKGDLIMLEEDSDSHPASNYCFLPEKKDKGNVLFVPIYCQKPPESNKPTNAGDKTPHKSSAYHTAPFALIYPIVSIILLFLAFP